MRVRVNKDTIREFDTVTREKARQAIRDLDMFGKRGAVRDATLNRLRKHPKDYIALYFSDGETDEEFAVLYFDEQSAEHAFRETLVKGFLDATKALASFDTYGSDI